MITATIYLKNNDSQKIPYYGLGKCNHEGCCISFIDENSRLRYVVNTNEFLFATFNNEEE